MKKNETGVPININKSLKNERTKIREELENCFISVSNTQTEDEHTQTIKSRYMEDISVNESESYGKNFSDRNSIEDSAELSLGKNLGNENITNKLVGKNNYLTKETNNTHQISNYKIINKNLKPEVKPEEKQSNATDIKKSSTANYAMNSNDKSEKDNDSNYNPNLIFKKENLQTNNPVININKPVNTTNTITNNRSVSKEISAKPEINNKKTNNIIKSINTIINNTEKFSTQKEKIQVKPSNTDNYVKKDIEIFKSLKDEVASLKQTLFQYKKDKLNFEEEIAILKLEKEKLITIKDSQIATLNEKISKYEIEIKQLTDLNEFSKKRMDEFSPKAWKYDEIFEKYSKLSVENEKLLENNSTFKNLVNSTKKDKDDFSQKFEINRIELEAIKNDKFFLTKENLILNEKLKNSADKIKTLEEDIREIRKTNQKYIDQLTEKNFKIENSFQEKLKNELEEIKKKFECDKENLKKLYDDLAEKRVSYLTEEKDELKMKNLRHEKVLKEKEEQTEFLNQELRNLTKKTDEEISYLRIQLKIKSEDLERISNMYEENLNLIKILKNENESQKDKIDLLRTEIIKKESSFREEISELKSQNQIMKEKLASYEMIENELDKIIVDSAVMINDNSGDNEVLSVIKDIPTLSKRRISQCLMLANKIKIMHIEIEKDKNLIEKLENELKLTNEEKEVYKNVAQKSKQPYQYIIKNLQDMELENHKLSSNIEEKEITIKSLLRENEMLMEKIKALQSDMKIVLGNRQKMDSLEEIITRFVEKDKNYDTKANKFNTASYENTSTMHMTRPNTFNNFHSMNFNKTNFNLGTNDNIKNFSNQDSFHYGNSSIVIPERDMNRTNNISGSNHVPKWYANLKSKKI